ncbi:MAG: hypothetical protein R3F59_18345 [Myxococcota bacterium]
MIIPAVFFQKREDGLQDGVKTPEALELFEDELRAVTGGVPKGGGDGSGGTTTFSYSAGWLDVLQPDDCTY